MAKKITSLADTLPSDYFYLQPTVQDFLPFDDIENSMICLPHGHYRMVVEVNSINFYLKTAQEQETIEELFAKAINSFDFPYAFYAQTREINKEQLLKIIKDDVEKLPSNFKTLADYGNLYYQQFESMNSNTLIKRNFFIVSCDDASMMLSNNSEEARRQYAFNRLSGSVRKVHEAFSSIGLRCHCLNNEELAELLYIALNKDSHFTADNLADFMSDSVQAETFHDLQKNKLALLFEEFENKLQTAVLSNHEFHEEDLVKANNLLKKVSELKNELNEEAEFDYFEL